MVTPLSYDKGYYGPCHSLDKLGLYPVRGNSRKLPKPRAAELCLDAERGLEYTIIIRSGNLGERRFRRYRVNENYITCTDDSAMTYHPGYI